MCFLLLQRTVQILPRRTPGVLLLCLFLLGMWTRGIGQITHTASFTRLLTNAGIEYLEPLEQWLHVTLPPLHDYMTYDLVLENDRNDFEVRYFVHRGMGSDVEVPASVTVAGLVASIASNAPESEIRIQVPSDSLLREAFNADRGIIARFTPKADFSEKPFGALISLYQEGRPGIDIVVLYTDPEYDPMWMYRNVRYRE
jgi:hypothetical protein